MAIVGPLRGGQKQNRYSRQDAKKGKSSGGSADADKTKGENHISHRARRVHREGQEHIIAQRRKEGQKQGGGQLR